MLGLLSHAQLFYQIQKYKHLNRCQFSYHTPHDVHVWLSQFSTRQCGSEDTCLCDGRAPCTHCQIGSVEALGELKSWPERIHVQLSFKKKKKQVHRDISSTYSSDATSIHRFFSSIALIFFFSSSFAQLYKRGEKKTRNM